MIQLGGYKGFLRIGAVVLIITYLNEIKGKFFKKWWFCKSLSYSLILWSASETVFEYAYCNMLRWTNLNCQGNKPHKCCQ